MKKNLNWLVVVVGIILILTIASDIVKDRKHATAEESVFYTVCEAFIDHSRCDDLWEER